MDNEAAIKLTKTQTFHRRSRHIEHRHHFIRELVDRKLDNWEGEPSMPTNQTPADGQTNGMDEEVMFEKLFNEWINEILFWGACKVIGLQGLQNRRVYGWRSPLGDNSKDVLE